MKTAVHRETFQGGEYSRNPAQTAVLLTPDDLWHGYTVGFLDG